MAHKATRLLRKVRKLKRSYRELSVLLSHDGTTNRRHGELLKQLRMLKEKINAGIAAYMRLARRPPEGIAWEPDLRSRQWGLA